MPQRFRYHKFGSNKTCLVYPRRVASFVIFTGAGVRIFFSGCFGAAAVSSLPLVSTLIADSGRITGGGVRRPRASR